LTAVLVVLACLAVAGCSHPPAAELHAGYDLSKEDLEAMVSLLPEPIAQTIAANSAAFLERLAEVLELPAELLLVVDKDHNLGAGHVPQDLVSLDKYPLERSKSGMLLRAVVMPDALAMTEAAKQDGVTLVFSSAYRPYDYQETLYRRNVEELGPERADRESARPGASQHQLGTAVDFGSITDAFADTAAGQWLRANAWKYGFSLSYPEGYEPVTGYRYESWHYRYISRPAAYLERFFFGSAQHYLLSFLDDNRAALAAAYRDGRAHGAAGE